MVCRVRYKGRFEGYRIPFYPWLPFVFVAACVFMIYRSWTFMIHEGLIKQTVMIGVWVVLGVVLSFALKSRIDSKLHDIKK